MTQVVPNSNPQLWIEHIVFLNGSTLLDNSSISWFATVCSKQLRQHFCPLWAIPTCRVRFVFDERHVDPDEQLVVFLDNPDAPGAAAYHDKTPLGNPFSRIFVSAGDPLLSASHECCEQVLDPLCDQWDQDPATGLWHAREACDAIEESTYKIDGENVSDFLLPRFFGLADRAQSARAGSQLLTFAGSIDKPFATGSGGYQIVKDPKTGEISQVFDKNRSDIRTKSKNHPSSRTMHRLWGKQREIRRAT